MNTSRRGLFGWLLGGAAVAVAAPEIVRAAAAEAPAAQGLPPTGNWAGDGSHTHSFQCAELPAHPHHFATRLDEHGFRRIS